MNDQGSTLASIGRSLRTSCSWSAMFAVAMTTRFFAWCACQTAGTEYATLLPVPQGPSPRAWRPPRMASSTMRESATWPSRIS